MPNERYPWRRRPKFEKTRSETGYDIPLAGKWLDQNWMQRFNLWLQDEDREAIAYSTHVRAHEWYPLDDASLGSGDIPLHTKEGPDDPGVPCIIEGQVVCAAVLRRLSDLSDFPALILASPMYYEDHPFSEPKVIDHLVGISLENLETLPLVLKRLEQE